MSKIYLSVDIGCVIMANQEIFRIDARGVESYSEIDRWPVEKGINARHSSIYYYVDGMAPEGSVHFNLLIADMKSRSVIRDLQSFKIRVNGVYQSQGYGSHDTKKFSYPLPATPPPP